MTDAIVDVLLSAVVVAGVMIYIWAFAALYDGVMYG